MSTFKKYIKQNLANEATSLLSRLGQMQPFALTMPMVASAAIPPNALLNITLLLDSGHRKLKNETNRFILWLDNTDEDGFNPEKGQARFTMLKLRFNSILNQLDIFADVLSQRAEHGVGIWIAGLDALAQDALKAGKDYYDAPDLIVYLDRGHGAAIRKARTRLPGGELNPVAVIQIPRERMVGSGIAASLIHEVGHQGAALLDLIASIKPELQKMQREDGENKNVWALFERWISEIIADFWAMAHLGICATQGLMGVLSLPSYFQFRIDLDDPHPAPYIRAILSCRLGKKIYPHPQWQIYENMWDEFYPQNELPEGKAELITKIKSNLDIFAGMLINHKPRALKGTKLIDIFNTEQRQPEQLQNLYLLWGENPQLIREASPTLIFAVIGQAKADNKIAAGLESRLLTTQLIRWAYWKSRPLILQNKLINNF